MLTAAALMTSACRSGGGVILWLAKLGQIRPNADPSNDRGPRPPFEMLFSPGEP